MSITIDCLTESLNNLSLYTMQSNQQQQNVANQQQNIINSARAFGNTLPQFVRNPLLIFCVFQLYFTN